MAKGISKLLRSVSEAVQREIRSQTDQSSPQSRGLAYEGWQGGYLQAIRDVQLALNGIKPTTRCYWEKENGKAKY